jgi:hypothetical protein
MTQKANRDNLSQVDRPQEEVQKEHSPMTAVRTNSNNEVLDVQPVFERPDEEVQKELDWLADTNNRIEDLPFF